MKGYYFITDSKLSRAGNLDDVRCALKVKVGVVQYREKYKSTRQMYEEAYALRKICRDALFLVNDRLDVALAVSADGVHLGKSDLPYALARKIMGRNKIIGLTVHSFKEALQAQKAGADYIGVAPIFATSTKRDAGKPVGVELLKRIKGRVKIPVVAIGGINLANAPDVIESGVDALCAISAVVTSNNVKVEVGKFQRLFHNNP